MCNDIYDIQEKNMSAEIYSKFQMLILCLIDKKFDSKPKISILKVFYWSIHITHSTPFLAVSNFPRYILDTYYQSINLSFSESD